MRENNCPPDRWAWVEIDLGAVRSNVRAFKKQLESGVRMMCVVKADAYGHGAVRCADVMSKAGAYSFAVATPSEGVELRKSGIEEPIVVLSEPPISAIPMLIEYDLEPAVYTIEFALAFGEAAADAGTVGKYHMAIDTGMHRIGVTPDDALDFRHAVDFHRGLTCAGVFTHFATAEVPDDWDFRMQCKRFTDTVNALKSAGYETGLIHCDNTPGTILHKGMQFDMCRVGIGLYGLHAAPITASYIDLKPVMAVKARVTRAIEPEVGEGVGYGMTYRIANKGTQIATIPLGYADGLARELSNRMDVIVNGTRCPQVGNICMDQTMFAVPPASVNPFAPSTRVGYGDVVTLIGQDDDEAITLDDMARTRRTINYEVACDFGLRLEKIYV